MGWAETRARLLSADPSVVGTDDCSTMPVSVRRAKEWGWVEVQDPLTGEWHELAYEDLTPVWKAALSKKRNTT